jgi:hypothetical protein
MPIKKRRRMVKSIMYAKSLLCVSAISNSRSILKGVAICIRGIKAIYYLKIKMSVLIFLMINLFLFEGTIFTTAGSLGLLFTSPEGVSINREKKEWIFC